MDRESEGGEREIHFFFFFDRQCILRYPQDARIIYLGM